MRKILFFLTMAVFFVHCKKESDFDEFGYSGKGTALLNRMYWSGSSYFFPNASTCAPDTCITIGFHYFENGYVCGNISIQYVPLSVGKKKLGYAPNFEKVNNKFLYSTIEGGDLVTGIYQIYEESEDNFVDITAYNAETGDIKGSFQATVVMISAFTPQGAVPDTIRITNGDFYGKVYWEKWE